MSCSCRDCAHRITAYLDGALPPDEMDEMKLHLTKCPPCADYAEQLKRTIAAAKELPCTGPCEEAKKALIAKVRGKCGGHDPSPA